MMKTVCAPLALATILFGCVSAPSLEGRLTQYVGLSEAEVVKKLGAPTVTSLDEKGRRVLTFGKRGLFQHPDCVATVVLNENERVLSWNWSGRHCETFSEPVD